MSEPAEKLSLYSDGAMHACCWSRSTATSAGGPFLFTFKQHRYSTHTCSNAIISYSTHINSSDGMFYIHGSGGGMFYIHGSGDGMFYIHGGGDGMFYIHGGGDGMFYIHGGGDGMFHIHGSGDGMFIYMAVVMVCLYT